MSSQKPCRSKKVVGIEKFGMFVEFLPAKTGLVHTSELGAGEALGDFDVGDEVDVHLVSVRPAFRTPLTSIHSGELDL